MSFQNRDAQSYVKAVSMSSTQNRDAHPHVAVKSRVILHVARIFAIRGYKAESLIRVRSFARRCSLANKSCHADQYPIFRHLSTQHDCVHSAVPLAHRPRSSSPRSSRPGHNAHCPEQQREIRRPSSLPLHNIFNLPLRKNP